MHSIRLPSGKEVIVEVTRRSAYSLLAMFGNRTLRLADNDPIGDLFKKEENAKINKIQLPLGTKPAGHIGGMPEPADTMMTVYRQLEEVVTEIRLTELKPAEGKEPKVLIGTAMWKRHQPAQPEKFVIDADGNNEERVVVIKPDRHDVLSKQGGRIAAFKHLLALDNNNLAPKFDAGCKEAYARFMRRAEAAFKAAEHFEDMVEPGMAAKIANVQAGMVDLFETMAAARLEARQFFKSKVIAWDSSECWLTKADRTFLFADICPKLASKETVEAVAKCTTRLPDPAKAKVPEAAAAGAK